MISHGQYRVKKIRLLQPESHNGTQSPGGSTLNMALSLSRRSGRFFRGSSLVVCSSSFQSLVWRQISTKNWILGEKNNNFTFSFISLMCFCVQLCPPVQVCAPHNPGGRCRRPQLGHSPWRGPPAELSSCTPGKAWPSSQTGVSGPCSKTKQKKISLAGSFVSRVVVFCASLAV